MSAVQGVGVGVGVGIMWSKRVGRCGLRSFILGIVVSVYSLSPSLLSPLSFSHTTKYKY